MTLSNRPLNQCESPRRRERKWAEDIWRNNSEENFPKFDERHEYKYLEVQQTPSKMNSKRSTPRHTL